mmetsp:Transcript_33568/g.83675  ORF Transcript_33568/g.83675 Transcript_33568/m.83675 type:complete len:284 (+) Transcript_33568:371-1222(+)
MSSALERTTGNDFSAPLHHRRAYSKSFAKHRQSTRQRHLAPFVWLDRENAHTTASKMRRTHSCGRVAQSPLQSHHRSRRPPFDTSTHHLAIHRHAQLAVEHNSQRIAPRREAHSQLWVVCQRSANADDDRVVDRTQSMRHCHGGHARDDQSFSRGAKRASDRPIEGLRVSQRDEWASPRGGGVLAPRVPLDLVAQSLEEKRDFIPLAPGQRCRLRRATPGEAVVALDALFGHARFLRVARVQPAGREHVTHPRRLGAKVANALLGQPVGQDGRGALHLDAEAA